MSGGQLADKQRGVVKVVWVVSTLRRRGPTNQLHSLLAHLDRTRFVPSVVTLSPEPSDSLWKDFAALDVECLSLGLSRWEGLLVARRRLERLLETMTPDLVHTHGIRADRLAARLKGPWPRVATIHNFPELDYPLTYGRTVGWLMVCAHVAAMRRLDLCIGVSGAVAQNLSERYGVERAVGIPNGVFSVADTVADLDEKRALRRRLELPEKGPIGVVVGHLSRRKNPLFLIRRWQALQPAAGEAQLLFLGDGELLEACREEAKGDSSIHLMGRVGNVNEYMRACDLYLSPSVAEGLPMAAIEALAAGLPLLLSDIPPHREIVSLAPSVGRLFRVNDAADFALQLQNLLAAEHASMAEAALALARGELGAATMARRYQAEYEQLLK